MFRVNDDDEVPYAWMWFEVGWAIADDAKWYK